jgi:hypothetical protein
MRGLNAEIKRSPFSRGADPFCGPAFFFGVSALINRNKTIPTMQDRPTLSRRRSTDNPNHNLWNNNGTWWLHYTCYPTAVTKERRRCSLRTRDLALARLRRDDILSRLAAES